MSDNYLWQYGIEKILKRKKYFSGEVILCKLMGDMYSVMTFDENNILIDAYTRICCGYTRRITMKCLNNKYNLQKNKLMKK